MPDQPDLTELVKHLRTVHFVLLLACILTLLPTMAGRRDEVSMAHLQLQKINTIRNSWNRWTQRFSLDQINWLRQLGVGWLAPKPEHYTIDSAALTEAGIRHSPGYVLGVRLVGAPLYFSLSGRWGIVLAVPHGELHVSDVLPLEISFPGEDSGSRPFTTLKDFREFWVGARLPMVTFLHRVSSVAYMIVDGKIQSELKLKETNRAGGTQDFRSGGLGGCPSLKLELIHQHVGHTGFNELFCTELDPGRLVIPADVRSVRVPTNLQQWLIQEFRLDGAGGDFPEMFPELDRVTNLYQILDMDKIDKILRAELARQGDRIQFLGISLPESRMASWGVVIVFAIQVYFWLHLRAFNSGATPNTTDALRYTGWIGLYNDRWASCVSTFTVSCFPPLVVACAWWSTSPQLHWVLVFMPFVLMLSWASQRLLSKMNHLAPTEDDAHGRRF